MNPSLPDIAVEFGESATRAFASLGGVDFARAAELEPARRSEALTALRALGAEELDVAHDGDALAAAAALCLAAGRVVLPAPVAGMVLTDSDGRPFAVVPPERCRVDHGDLFGTWRIATVVGTQDMFRPAGAPIGTRLGPFVADLAGEVDFRGADVQSDVARHLTLTAWQILGVCERAVELTVEHVNTRVQFGKPLAVLQSVQFAVADAAVAVAGLRELAQFTLWRVAVDASGAMADALGLRVHALDVARAVLRACQQLHGAAGVCDEYDISVLVRHVQPALRLPFGAERAAIELARAIDRDGFQGLFPHGALV